jgi:hypothetical protein
MPVAIARLLDVEESGITARRREVLSYLAFTLPGVLLLALCFRLADDPDVGFVERGFCGCGGSRPEK